MFEQQPIRAMAKEGELMAFPHDGFWQPMDTFSEFNFLNRLWAEGNAPWKTWKTPTLFAQCLAANAFLLPAILDLKGMAAFRMAFGPPALTSPASASRA